jgi:hypothetical protein
MLKCACVGLPGVLRDHDVLGWFGGSPDGLIECLMATPGARALRLLK